MVDIDSSPVPDVAARLRLDGRRFLVLGGGYGTGRQSCHALASLGAGVVVVDVDGDRARRVAGEIDGVAAIGDASDRGDMTRLFSEAEERLGGIDGVVDVIGAAEWGGILYTGDDRWARQHDITLRHVFLALQLGGAAMAGGSGGTMVFVSSVSGLLSSANHAAYGAGKAGLLSLVKSAAEEFGPLGIRVNAVVPGSVSTPRVVAMRAAGLIRPWEEDRVAGRATGRDGRHRRRHRLSELGTLGTDHRPRPGGGRRPQHLHALSPGEGPTPGPVRSPRTGPAAVADRQVAPVVRRRG